MEGDDAGFDEYSSAGYNYDYNNDESMDAVRGYSLLSNDFGGGDDDFFGLDPTPDDIIAAQLQNSGIEDEDGDDVKAPAMPTEFYYEIDSFLKKSPPKFNDPVNGGSNSIKSQKGIKKKKDKPSNADASEMVQTRQPQGRALPPIVNPPPAEQKINKSKSSKVISGESSKQGRTIDPQLLRDAFAYTDQLLRNAIQEEAKETQQQQSQGRTIDDFVSSKRGAMGMGQQHPHSAPGGGENNSADSKRRPQQQPDRSHVSIVRSLKANKSQQQQPSNQAGGRPPRGSNSTGGGDFVVAKEEETDMRRNPINYDELLANFQSGSNLEKLRKELKDSLQSLQTSSRAIRNLMTFN